jgi:hypothetical protein
LNKKVKIIIWRGFVPFLKSAFFALVDDHVFALFNLYCCGFHHSVALPQPVAGIDVHVLAVKAIGTMIGKAGAFGGFAAVLAGKIFNFALE